MDAKALFWTGALINMALVVAVAASGVRQIRRGAVEKHRRRMLSAAALIGVFVVAYGVKLVVLGREELARWSDAAIWNLRLHELCVLVMLVAGAEAGRRAVRMRNLRVVTGKLEDPEAPEELRVGHRRAGWTALLAAATGWLLASVVLYGMVQRLSDPVG